MHSALLSAGGIVEGADQGLRGIMEALAVSSAAVFKGGMPAAVEADEMVPSAAVFTGGMSAAMEAGEMVTGA